MNLFEFADLIKTDIIIRRYPKNGPEDARFFARLDCCEIKEGIALCGSDGSGETITEALNKHAQIISEKHIVLNAMGESRKEYHPPKLEEIKD